ncbi:hypothetical protein SK571_42365 [Lentzea sp. BCCO 10_0798]|uniref:site-specific DNA-methyltransferase (cytosine-N(4)-specific) n=1 Tax=Lentzea kristufekii TaxID=3095430 RepID=A0ABU4U665_9PSEU|nr:hypothetical protein [Lentzea sp. BCCO 10_0798]MDX8056061.1 hypothetical protein [Lentzea sp. BCCO 10_0798]
MAHLDYRDRYCIPSQDQEAGSEVAGRSVSRGQDQGELFAATATQITPQGKLSPKRPRVETAGLADVFPYYAGFSFDWAVSHLTPHLGGESTVVLDPWNGSGTTTLAAQSLGVPSVGLDLNPIANVVAHLRAQVASSTRITNPPRARKRSASVAADPLSHWLSPSLVTRVREWTDSFTRQRRDVSTLGIVALFRVVRRLTKDFEGSNPTWVRRASEIDMLVDLPHSEFDKLLLDDQRQLLDRLQGNSAPKAPVALLTGSSTNLPIADCSVDVTLTSPPYLTRIDYAVAYARELAICGIDIAADRTLRSGLMGTTLIRRPTGTSSNTLYCPLADDLVRQIAGHGSKASSGYYLKQARQYLDDLVASFDEITRVSKPGAVLIMVVQDSYYKEIPIRLADICEEEAKSRGWSFSSREQFEVVRSLTSIHAQARTYPKGKVSETVLTLRKEV